MVRCHAVTISGYGESVNGFRKIFAFIFGCSEVVDNATDAQQIGAENPAIASRLQLKVSCGGVSDLCVGFFFPFSS